ncbi:4'-phosphopantetheinyl transferase superfamily protein [Kitasatospora sp. GAS204B]|uniref:4'-phosphopantetheinyl transferase family protein n=1 Tax=unclassified Kitasatospora TaxID=2633591 RepID=UPI0024741B22|nr:4'-phosphopantetheinyl transferase superfamily protein [Kitasatospora sp. GAS204B]MDH6120030.1 4'-phosphopantetheinyl transferase [Kitasatospora sp. GAS204B]
MLSGYPLPLRGAAHVWLGDGSSSDPVQDLTLLSDTERSRCTRFFSPEDRRRYVAAWAAVRRVLAGYLDTGPGEIRLGAGRSAARDSGSYPQLVVETSQPRVCLSVARSEDLWVLGLAVDDPIGVDVEHVRGFDTEGLIDRCLAPEEQRQVRTLSGGARDAAFVRAWTRKQAVMKAAGLPRATAPHQVLVPSRGPTVVRVELLRDALRAPGGWLVQDLPPAGSALAAIARPESCAGPVNWYDGTSGNTPVGLGLPTHSADHEEMSEHA